MACVTLDLGGTSLNPNMVWVDREASASVAQSTVRTLGGSLVVYSAGLSFGVPITLVADEDQGWLTKAQVDALRTMADNPGGQYVLTVDTNTYNVIFDHENAPAFSASPLIPRLNPSSGDYYIATIKLLTI